MRVLLIGQKIVTLEDLNSYFFEHNVHGYVSAGAPNLLSLDIVRQCGIHMVICQTSDYTMEHLLTFMNKVKEHDPTIVTLLITDISELPKINESMLDLIDDFLVVPFTPTEFHTRLIKLISKSTSPHSKVSAEERLKSILALMSEHPELKNDRYLDPEIDDYYDDEDVFIPNLDLVISKIPVESDIVNFENGPTGVSSDYNEDSRAADDEMLGGLQAGTTPKDFVDLGSEGLAVAGLTPLDLTPLDLSQEEIVDSDMAAEDNLESAVTKSDSWASSRFEDLMDGIDFDKEPILSKFKKLKSNDNPLSIIKSTESEKPTVIEIKNDSKVIKDVLEISKVEQTDNETRVSGLNKFLELFGRIIYMLVIIIMVLLSVIVIKSYYDGGIATFSEYGIYSNTGEFQNSNPNLMKSSYPGALIVSGGVRPGTPFGDQVLLILPWLGYIVDYAKTPIGFLIVVVAPLLLIFIIEIYYWIQRREAKYY